MKVAFIFSGLPDGLQCLNENRQKISETLSHYGWDTRVDSPFHSTSALLNSIKEYENKEIEDFIFFYTGHGETSNSDTILTLKLHDGTPIDINVLHRDYISKLNIKRKAIILDACYSGNIKKDKIVFDEYLCSSDFDEESHEDTSEGGLQQSYFSYYFCEAIKELNGEVTLKMVQEVIENNMKENHSDIVQNPTHVSVNCEMVIADKVLEAEKEKLTNKNKIFIDYITLNNFEIKDIAEASKLYLDRSFINEISQKDNIADIITYISNHNEFPSIINELFLNNDEAIQEYLDTNRAKIDSTPKIVSKSITPRLTIIFKKSIINNQKYKVIFKSKGLLTKSNSNNGDDEYDLLTQKEELTTKIISYIQEEIPKVDIDLILPSELMTENIKLWYLNSRKRKSISRLSNKVNIGFYNRYNLQKTLLNIIKKKWKEILDKYEENEISNSLFPINCGNDIDLTHDNMEYAGIKLTCTVDKDDFDDIFDLKIKSLIMLWTTEENTNDFEYFKDTPLKELKDKFFTNNYAVTPLNLMWDDPNRYYYGDV